MSSFKAKQYEGWRDSRPATCFPFSHRERGEVYQQTWQDVRERLNRDASSHALAFATSHFAPSVLQSNILDEICRREQKTRSKMLDQINASQRRSREQRQRREEEAQQHADDEFKRRAGEALARTVIQQRPSSCIEPRPHRTSIESEVLKSGAATGGKSRVAYLKMRRQLPMQARFNRINTTSQSYGWELLNWEEKDRLLKEAEEKERTIAASQILPSSASGQLDGNSTTMVSTQQAASATVATSYKRPMSASQQRRQEHQSSRIINAPAPVQEFAQPKPPLRPSSAPAAGRGVAAARQAQGDFRRRSFASSQMRSSGVFSAPDFV